MHEEWPTMRDSTRSTRTMTKKLWKSDVKLYRSTLLILQDVRDSVNELNTGIVYEVVNEATDLVERGYESLLKRYDNYVTD